MTWMTGQNAPSASLQVVHLQTRSGPAKGHKGDYRTRAPVIQEKFERTGTVHSRESSGGSYPRV